MKCSDDEESEFREINLEKYDEFEVEQSSKDFYFESDHLALRGNADYRSVLRTIVILEAQRIEATKNIDQIAAAEKAALKDPLVFLQRLLRGENQDLPGSLHVQNLPKINFEKYNVPAPLKDEIEPIQSTNSNDLIVRGRVFDQSKPETFNQLWTCEEQQRLEELLLVYPPEPVEMRRFAKIARALGNRTVKQVASRLQKYFQKLHAAGLPVPGRIPRNARTYSSARKNRITKMIRPTTFFPSNYDPVTIIDDDENNANAFNPSFYRNGYEINESSGQKQGDNGRDTIIVDEPSDNESKDDNSPEQKIIRLMKRVKQDKEKNYSVEMSNDEHIGYKCDLCDEDPLMGTRWHCVTCENKSIDFCSDCLICQLQSDSPHPLDHKIIGLKVSTDYESIAIGATADSNYDEDDDDDEE